MALRLKIPPPVVGLSIGLTIYLLDQLASALKFELVMFKLIAFVFFCAGIAIEAWSVWAFYRVRTTVNPLRPENSQVLVTIGLYRYTRNPMYLGMLLLLTGWVFWVGNPVGLPMLFVFVWYLTEFQIKPEEQILDQLFGEQFIEYTQRVGRWL